ncbi:MAG: hypothetical protein K0S34_1013 [Bacillales bacterium]|jgi:hypothetical protein|nr:hypothetical protein [Bacillales bacterium]
MRKYIYLVLATLLITISISTINKPVYSKQSDNKLIHDAFLTALSPHISKEIINYYGYQKQFALFDGEISSIERETEGGFSFKVKVQVYTFEAAHNAPYGKETIIFKVDAAGINEISFEHIGDDDEKKMKEFYEATLKDIIKTFNLNLKSYKSYTSRQLEYMAESSNEYKSLVKIVGNIFSEVLESEVKIPLKNIIKPVTYIKNEDGYILFKREDGTNVAVKIHRSNGVWRVVDTKSSKGKRMKYELIYYM